MSTYYALYCEACRDKANFVSGSGDHFTWMGPEAMTEVTIFMGTHHRHLEHIRVISEVDPRWFGAMPDDWRDARR